MNSSDRWHGLKSLLADQLLIVLVAATAVSLRQVQGR